MKNTHHFVPNNSDSVFRFIFQETRKNDEILTGEELVEYEKDDMPFLDNLRKNLEEGEYKLNMKLIKAEMTLESELKAYTKEKNEIATQNLEVAFNKILNIAEPILEKNASLTNMMLKDFQQLQIEHFGKILFDPREGNDTKNLLKLTEVQITSMNRAQSILTAGGTEKEPEYRIIVRTAKESTDAKNKISKQTKAFIESLQFILQPGISKHFGLSYTQSNEINQMMKNHSLRNMIIQGFDEHTDKYNLSDFNKILKPLYENLEPYGFNSNTDSVLTLFTDASDAWNNGEYSSKISAKFMQAFAKFIEAGINKIQNTKIATWDIYKEQQTIEVQNLSSKEDFLYVQNNDLKLLPKDKQNEVLERVNEQIKNTETEIQTAKKDLLLSTVAINLFLAVDSNNKDYNNINWDFENTFSYTDIPATKKFGQFFQKLGSRVGINKKPKTIITNKIQADRNGRFSGDEKALTKANLAKEIKNLDFSDVSNELGGETIDIVQFLELNEQAIRKKMSQLDYGKNASKTANKVSQEAKNASIHTLQKLLKEKSILQEKKELIKKL